MSLPNAIAPHGGGVCGRRHWASWGYWDPSDTLKVFKQLTSSDACNKSIHTEVVLTHQQCEAHRLKLLEKLGFVLVEVFINDNSRNTLYVFSRVTKRLSVTEGAANIKWTGQVIDGALKGVLPNLELPSANAPLKNPFNKSIAPQKVDPQLLEIFGPVYQAMKNIVTFMDAHKWTGFANEAYRLKFDPTRLFGRSRTVTCETALRLFRESNEPCATIIKYIEDVYLYNGMIVLYETEYYGWFSLATNTWTKVNHNEEIKKLKQEAVNVTGFSSRIRKYLRDLDKAFNKNFFDHYEKMPAAVHVTATPMQQKGA